MSCMCVDWWVACAWLGNPWTSYLLVGVGRMYGVGRGRLGGELRGLTLIVFLQCLLGM